MKRKRSKLWISLVVIALAAVTVIVVNARRAKPTVVQTALVEQVARLTSLVTATGTVEAKESVDIQTEVAGVIIELPVEEGDWVKRGQILLRIDPFQTRADLDTMSAQLAATEADAAAQKTRVAEAEASLARDHAFRKGAEADLVQAEARLELTGIQLERRKGLLEDGVISQEELDSARTEQRAAKAAKDAIKARIDQYIAQARATQLTIEQAKAAHKAALARATAARASMQRAEDSFKKTTIHSPLDGLLTHLNVEEGERAVPGILSNPQATLMTIADMSTLEVWLLVDETDIVRVAIDNPVDVIVDALPDQTLHATVTEIGNAPVAAAGSQEGKDFLVKAALTDPPEELRPGMSCEGEIVTNVKRDVPVIPIQALTRREVPVDQDGTYQAGGLARLEQARSERGGQAIARSRELTREIDGVFLRSPDDHAVFRPVETGISGEMDIEVTSGLEQGEEVIIGPFKALRELEEGAFLSVDNSNFKRFRKRGEKPGA